jgi:hypothetical protein
VITPELRAPAVGEMRVLEGEELLAHEAGRMFQLLMGWLDMHCYLDPRGYYWVGVENGSFPEHDRWCFVLDMAEVGEKQSWRAADFYRVVNGEPYLMHELVGQETDLPSTLHDLFDTLENDPVGDRHHDLLLRALQIFQTLGSEEYPRDYAKLMRVAWGQDMHDLIHHTTHWSTHNPEFAGMPRELLLRMHGFDDATLALQTATCTLGSDS